MGAKVYHVMRSCGPLRSLNPHPRSLNPHQVGIFTKSIALLFKLLQLFFCQMQSTSFAPDGTAQTTSTPSGDDDGDICLLELDGGGVRGLSELYILKRVMDGIDPINPPKPCDYFDMIGGTSTGG